MTKPKFLKYAMLPANKTLAAPALSIKMANAVPLKAMSAPFITTTISSAPMARSTTLRFLSAAASLKMSALALILKNPIQLVTYLKLAAQRLLIMH